MSVNTRALQFALRGPVLAIPTLPDVRAWENARTVPSARQPYIDEAFVPATATFVGNGPLGGYTTVTGLYLLTWYDVADDATLTLATRADAVLDAYRPGTSLVTSDGVAVTIRTNPAPYRGQVKPLAPGRACVVITIPWTATVRLPAIAA